MPIVKKTTSGNSKPHSVKHTAASSAENISFPTANNDPPEHLWDYSVFIFGEKGVGKTYLSSLLAAASDNGITYSWERGRRNLPIRMVPKPDEPRLDWLRQKAYFSRMLETGKRWSPVIDTFDRAYEGCSKHVCQSKFGVNQPASLGKESYEAYNAVKFEFEDTMADLIQGGIAPIFTSHCTLKEVEKPDGALFSLLQPTLSGVPFNIAKSITDLAIYIGLQGNERVMYVRGNDFIWSACNIHEHFLDPDGNPIYRIHGGSSAVEMCDNLLAGFRNELYDYDPEPLEPNEEGASLEEEEEEPPPKPRKKK